MSQNSSPPHSFSPWLKLTLPWLLALISILALNLALASPHQTALAYSVTVDGDASDWVMTPTNQVNLGHVVRDTSYRGEYVWNDNPGDERAVFSATLQEDITGFRVTADRDNLYFSVAMSDVITATGAGAPQIRVAVDTDRQANSGEASLGSSTETSTTVTATWEYLLVTPFGSAASPTSETILYQGGFATQTLTGTAVISTASDLIEFSVPWTALGMSEPPTLPLRFTVASFRAQADDTTQDITGGSDALDAITNYGDPGVISNTLDEVSDGVVDYYFDLWFEPDGDVYAPLLVSEVLYDTAGVAYDFIEIYNASPISIDLTSYKVGDEETIGAGEGMEQFLGGWVAPGEVVVWAHSTDEFTATYGFLPDYAHYDDGYPVSTTSRYLTWATLWINLALDDEVILLDGSDTAIDVVEWNDPSPEWPGLANTDFAVSNGQSMERAPADWDSNDIARDFIVQPNNGTPGQIVHGVDLAIAKTVHPPAAAPGETVTYTLAFSNTGAYTATGVVITDTVPVSVTNTTVVSSGVVITPHTGTRYVWDVAALAPGDGGVITVTGILSPSLPAAHLFTNTASITFTANVTLVVDTAAGNNSDAAGILVSYADLTVTKFADPEPAVAGMPLTYTILITNAGNLTATNVTISDTLPPSTTLQTLAQRDDSAAEFNAGTHNNTRWYDPRPGYDYNAEWLEIENTLLVSGVYTSRVMDARNVVSWTQLSWRPRRPTWKPLPDNGAAEEYYVYGAADMGGNRLLLHLDSTNTLSDTSGHGNDGACPATISETCPTAGADGRFNGALSFDGALSQTVAVTDTHDPLRYALELWVYPTIVTDTSFILRTDTPTDTALHYSHLLGIVDGHFQHTLYDGAYRTITSTTPVTPNMWHHIVGTAESNGDMKLFVDGVQEAKLDGIGPLWTGGDWYRLGSTYGPTGTAHYFSGRLDEVAVYSRTLSSGEVLDHYLRGALRLSFDVRSCDDPTCVGKSWSGSYSEQTNTGLGWPTVTFSPPLADNRYFQYRATLASDAPDYTPELLWVRAHPDHRAVFASQGSCATQPSAFTCDLGDLSGGGLISITAFVNVNPSALGVITNSATVSATNDITTTNNSAAVTSTVTSEVYISIQKYDDDDPDHDGYDEWNYGMADPVNPGSPMTYTLEIHNGGPSDAWDVVITDALPITVTGVAAHGDWASCVYVSNTITCTAASLGDYTWRHLIITGTAPSAAGWITNTAWVTANASSVYTTSHISDTEITLITPLADLSIVKSASPDPVDPGAVITFTVIVTNSGPSPASGVVVTDTLQNGLTGHASGGGWSCSGPGSTIVCTLPSSLTVGASDSFQITATAPLSGFVGNVAVVASATCDPDEENNTAYAYARVLPVANLHISKTDTLDPVDAGTPLTYTLVVSNSGYVDAGARETILTLANGNHIAIPWGGRARPYPSSIYIGGLEGTIRTLTVTLENLNHTYPGDLEVLLVGPDGQSVVLMANAGGGADVDATLTIHDTGIVMPVSDTLTSTVVYRPTNHGLTGDLPQPAPAGPYGGSLSTFYNSSPNGVWRLYIYDTFDSDGGALGGWRLYLTTRTTDTVTVSDTLPAGLTSVSVAAPAGWDHIGNDPLTYEADTLPVGVPAVFTITATAPITGGVITNTAAITSTTADFWPDSNEDTITTTITAVADLSITKTVEPLDVVGPGMPLTYTLAISNGGPSPVQTPVVTDALPAGLTGVSAPVYCDLSALPALTCTLASLAPGGTTDVVITATAPITPGVITNTAGVTATVRDSDLLNNTALVTVTVAERADLQIVKTIQPVLVTPNAPLTYTLHITNAGPSAAQAVTVTDSITGVVAIGTPGGTGWSCNQAGGAFTCTIGSLSVGQSSILFTATAPAAGGIITNSAVITSAAPPDQYPLNNVSVLTTPVSFPPTVTVPFEDYVTAEDVSQIITFTVGDPDTPLASLNLAAQIEDTTLIPNVLFGGAGVNRTLTITPAADLNGASRITITVTDGAGLSDSDLFTLTVTPVNDAPWFTSTPVQAATVGRVYTYSITADDVDLAHEGDVLTITAPTAPAWLTLTDNRNGTASLDGTPAEADLGNHAVSLLVRDSGGLTDTQSFTVTVVRGTYYIYLPLVTRNYAVAPDLVVDSIVATQNGVTVTISNQGPAPVEGLVENEFWVDVYFDPSAAPTYNQTWEFLCDHGLVWGVTADALPLDPGETLVLTVGDGYYRADKSDVAWPLAAGTEVWAQVDSANESTTYGAVEENHEIIGGPYNNVTQMSGTVAVAKFDKLPRKP